METFIKVNGRMIRLMEKESIIIMMAPATQENGVKTFNKDMEYKNGSMDPHTKGKNNN